MFIAVALAALTMTAPPADPAPPGEPVPPAEELALARAQFDNALAANLIDPAMARDVACTSSYRPLPSDPAQQVVGSLCFGLVEIGGPPTMLYATDTVHYADGSVQTWVYPFGEPPAPLGEPITGEPTAPITFPAPTAGATPPTAAGASEPEMIVALQQQLQSEWNLAVTEEQARCMMDSAGGFDQVLAGVESIYGYGLECGVDLSDSGVVEG